MKLEMPEPTAASKPPNAAARTGSELGVAESVISAFATPLVNYRWPDAGPLNMALRELILRVAQVHPGIQKSNVGGWHSTLDFMNWDFDCVRELRGKLQRFAVELTRMFLLPQADGQRLQFQLDGWANVLRHGQYCNLHSHPNCFWSGVYYVTDNHASDGHPLSGKLELFDPRPSASSAHADNTNLYGRLLLNPVAGQMLVFPSWLSHCVHPYFGESERISVGFNVRFDVLSA